MAPPITPPPAGPLGPARRDAVLAKLGFDAVPAADHDGLTALYRAWCRRVPFDNVRKLIALADAATIDAPPTPLPGGVADDFFDAWLTHGTGGTCWPSANALHVLLEACGFASRRLAASMFETGEPSHGTTVVTVESDEGFREHLVDTSMLTDVPVPLDRTASTATRHPVFGTVTEVVPEGWRFEFPLLNDVGTLPCRTLSPDAVGAGFFLERYEISRGWSPFNRTVSTRQVATHPDGDDMIVGFSGGRRYERRASSVLDVALDSDGLRAALIDDTGMSEQIVDRLFSSYRPDAPGSG